MGSLLPIGYSYRLQKILVLDIEMVGGRKLKERLKKEGSQTVTNCHQLKMVAEDGKLRLADIAMYLRWHNIVFVIIYKGECFHRQYHIA
jgi:hypothetical protein